MIRCTKHVYAPPEVDDGCRLIVMPRYPRGVAKWRAHGFLPGLAPTLPLVHWYHEQKNAIEAQWRNANPECFGTEVWAYGSRTTGAAHAASDLDLVLRNPDRLGEHTPVLRDLREALVESNLPIRVDVMDWARVSASFHQEIECCQKPK